MSVPAKSVEIRTFHDLLTILREHPDLLDELRRLILTEELLNLPQRFEQFVTQEFRPLKERVDRLEARVSRLERDMAEVKQDVAVLKQDVAVLKQDVAVLKQDVAGLKQDVAGLKQDVAELKGDNLERRVREHGPAYFSHLLRRTRVLSKEQLVDILDDALDAGRITEQEWEDALKIDVVLRGRLWKTGEERVVAVEVSYKVDARDVERAHRRAQVLARAFGVPALAAVFGYDLTAGARERAKNLKVLTLLRND